MRISKRIENELREAFNCYKEAHAHMTTVEKYMRDHCESIEDHRDGSGFGIEEIENATCEYAVDNFIAYANNDFDIDKTFKEVGHRIPYDSNYTCFENNKPVPDNK